MIEDPITLSLVSWLAAMVSGAAFGYMLKGAIDAHIEAAAYRIALERERRASRVIDVTAKDARTEVLP